MIFRNMEQKGYRLRRTHRFISADGVYLCSKHYRCEDEKEKSFKTQKDEKNHSSRWRERTALCKKATEENTEYSRQEQSPWDIVCRNNQGPV